jgi:hypothetical protein
MFFRLSLLFCSLAAALALAQDSASLSITVYDPSGAVVPAATVTLTDLQRGRANRAVTEGTGYAEFSYLQPSSYSLTVEKAGFQTYRIESMMLQVRDRQTMRVEMHLGAAETTTVVVHGAAPLSSDPSAGSPFEQSFVENLPTNGRSVDSLLLMTPGVTSAAGGKGDGGFNANGLRSTNNYYTLDGVSVNRPINGGAPGNGGGFGGFGGMGGAVALGGGSIAGDAITMDAMQEMKVQTSSFAPEFGRSPGAQIVMTSRSGTNDWHGSLYYYGRRDAFDANDWFSNAGGYAKGRERESRPGATFSGPLQKNKTYFFAAYEQLELTAPESILSIVPDANSRQVASSGLKPFLKAYPLPNGPSLIDGGAEFLGVVSDPSHMKSESIRVDHILTDKTTLFARYSLTPTGGSTRGSDAESPNVVTSSADRAHNATGGATHVFRNGMVDDLHVNYSKTNTSQSSYMDSFGGAVPLTNALAFPKNVTTADGSFDLSLMGFAGYSFGGRSGNEQQQINIVDTLTKVEGKHQRKYGFDYRRTLLTNYNLPYTNSVTFNGMIGSSQSVLGVNGAAQPQFEGFALNARVSSNTPEVYPTYMNFSAFGQDTYRATERTTVTYGLRWDLNPAPTTREGLKPLTASGDNVTSNSPIYPTRHFDVAPRFGVAYLCDDKPGHEKILRAGLGLFYDMGYGQVASAFSGAPFSNILTVSNVKFPLVQAYLMPPGLPATEPYGEIVTGDSGLSSPMIVQWNTTWEQHFGSSQLLNVTIAGTRGSNLLRTTTTPVYSDYYNILSTISNGASSTYNGLQIQYRRRLSKTFQTQASYTWSRSMDDASTDAGFGGGFANLYGSSERGPSDYDMRHSLSVSGSWLLPAPRKGLVFAPLRNWYLDFMGTAHSGLPFDIEGVSNASSSGSTINAGLFAEVRPDYTGQPVWLSDPHAPGGKKLNPAAFSVPDGYMQGNLGRNALRGFAFSQLDLTVRRVIPFTERIQLSIAGVAYNALNHPNFANPSPLEGGNMASPDFGVVTRMMDNGVGTGSTLYRAGGPRSLEAVVRLRF